MSKMEELKQKQDNIYRELGRLVAGGATGTDIKSIAEKAKSIDDAIDWQSTLDREWAYARRRRQ